MNLTKLVWSYLKARPLNTVLNVFLLSLGVAVISILLLFSRQIGEKITSNAKGVDLVVGAKGSPLQLILCSVFHIDFPTGNINLKEAERLAKHRLVKTAIPLALGDSYKNYRIVGTNRQYTDLYQLELAQGAWWKNDLEVVLGASVASELSMHVGDTFASSHGLGDEGHAHDESLYRVTGIAKPSGTVLDNLVFTNVASVWKVHEHEADTVVAVTNPSPLVPSVNVGDSTKEITSLLLQYRNPIAAIQLPRLINSQTNMQAASPAFETARLFSILGVGVSVLRGFAYVLIFISALSIFIALYNSLKERQYDLAIMRSMGASRSKLLFSIMMEGSALTLLGSVLGLALGHGALHTFTLFLNESQRAGLSAYVFYVEELFLLAASLLLGIVCSLIPAIQAYKTDIHKVLAGS
ncbi:MAG: ABC transporter permease [Bacteroidota bacterium]